MAEVERRAAATASLDERNALLIHAAIVWEEQVQDLDHALAAYGRVLESRPQHTEALTSMERLSQACGRFDGLALAYRRLISETKAPEARLELYYKLARIQEAQQGDLEAALVTLQMALAQDIRRDATALEVGRVALRADKLPELLSFCKSLPSSVADREGKVALSVKLGRWYLQEGRPDWAAACFNLAVQMRPDHTDAIRSLETIYSAHGHWESLQKVLTHLAQVAREADDKKEALLALGEVCEKQLDDRRAAADAYREALRLDQQSVVGAMGLRRTSQTKDDWSSLVSALELQLAERADPEESIIIRLEMADAFASRLDDAASAIAALQGILEHTPTDERALRELDTLLSSEERWEELIEVLDMRFTLAPTRGERVALLTRIAWVLEEGLDRQAEAIERLEAALRIDSSAEDVLFGLERLYRAHEQWDLLARTYARHLDATSNSRALVDLNRELGELYHQRLFDPHAAVQAMECALRIDGGNVPILDRLVLLYESVGDWGRERTTLEKLIRVVEAPGTLAEYHYVLANLLDGPLDDEDAAVEHLRQSTTLDPQHTQALVALRKRLEKRGDWPEAAQALDRLQDLIEDPMARSLLLTELGALNEEHLADEDRAIECFEAALDYDGRNVDAAAHLAELFFARERYRETAELLEGALGRSPSKLEPARAHRLWFLKGESARFLGDDEVALEAHRKARALDPDDLPTHRAEADLYLSGGAWKEAALAYKELLVRHGRALPQDQTVEVLHNLGVARLEQGEWSIALVDLEEALQVDPAHLPTHRVLLAYHQEHGNWPEVVRYKKALLQLGPATERVAALLEVAVICERKVRDLGGAIECVQQALELEPSSPSMLQRLVQLGTAANRWLLAIAAMEQIIEIEDDRERRATYHRTIGALYRDKLGEAGLAADHFNSCLDEDGKDWETFKALVRLRTAGEDWEGLEKDHHLMLKRVVGPTHEELRASLWDALGEINRDHLGQLGAAAFAYRMANDLDTRNVERQVTLADVYRGIPGERQKAIDKHQLLLEWDPTRTASYSQLFELYREAKQYDKAWCVSAALAYLGEANSEERLFFEDYRVNNDQRTSGAIDGRLWAEHLQVPETDRRVCTIFEAILPIVEAARAMPHKAFGLKGRNRLDPETGTESLSGLLSWAAISLGVRRPELYLKRDLEVPLAYAPTDPPASIAASSLMSVHGVPSVRFELGLHLATYHPDHYLRVPAQTAEGLRTMLHAALRVVRPELAAPEGDTKETKQLLRAIGGGLDPRQIARLDPTVDELLGEGGEPDIDRWMDAVEMTSCRAGLLLCGEIETAATMIKRYQHGPADMTPEETITKLLAFSISESYFRLRHSLGYTIDTT